MYVHQNHIVDLRLELVMSLLVGRSTAAVGTVSPSVHKSHEDIKVQSLQNKEDKLKVMKFLFLIIFHHLMNSLVSRITHNVAASAADPETLEAGQET